MKEVFWINKGSRLQQTAWFEEAFGYEQRRAFSATGSSGRAMDLESLNRYVLAAVGLLAALVYFGMVYAGFSKFISRLPKRRDRRKRAKTHGGSHR